MSESASQGASSNQLNKSCLLALNYVYLHFLISTGKNNTQFIPIIFDSSSLSLYKNITIKENFLNLLLAFSSYLNNVEFELIGLQKKINKTICNTSELRNIINNYIFSNIVNNEIEYNLKMYKILDLNNEELLNNSLLFKSKILYIFELYSISLFTILLKI